MAIATEKVEVAECNACGRREYSENGTFKGLAGSVKAEQNGFGFTVEWYSCSTAPGHIGRAVASAVNDGPQAQGSGYQAAE